MTLPQTQSPQSSGSSTAALPSQAGRFVWHDLMTTDPQAALAFYTRLFGWTTKEMDMGAAEKYTMLHVGDMGIGGVVPLDASHGIPSHWIGYATVDDVDAACARASDLGGTVSVPPTDIPNVGRFAVISDPTGARLSPFKASMPDAPEPAGPPPLGAFCWDEVMTTDTDRAGEFYRSVFGWTTQPVDMGPAGMYYLFKRGDKDAGGMMPRPAAAAGPPSWLSYVLVADVDASARRVEELGGKLHVQPRDIPGIGRFSVAQDPTGAVFALFKPAEQAE
jgi:uncharacterized protein